MTADHLPADPPALQFEAAAFGFGGSGQAPHTAVAPLSLAVAAGEVVALLGPMGCGKSSVLQAAAGRQPPLAGALRWFGQPQPPEAARIGHLPQTEQLAPDLAMLDNLVAAFGSRGLPVADAQAQARALLTRLGLETHFGYLPHQLSNGMRRRTALARCLALAPALLLLDEPFVALDLRSQRRVETELLSPPPAPSPRPAVLLASSDPEAALVVSDRVVVLSAGPAARCIGVFAPRFPGPRDPVQLRRQADFQAMLAEVEALLAPEHEKAGG